MKVTGEAFIELENLADVLQDYRVYKLSSVGFSEQNDVENQTRTCVCHMMGAQRYSLFWPSAQPLPPSYRSRPLPSPACLSVPSALGLPSFLRQGLPEGQIAAESDRLIVSLIARRMRAGSHGERQSHFRHQAETGRRDRRN